MPQTNQETPVTENGFDQLTPKQQAVVSALQRALTELNSELGRAADAGIAIDLQTLDISTVSDQTKRVLVSATAAAPFFRIA